MPDLLQQQDKNMSLPPSSLHISRPILEHPRRFTCYGGHISSLSDRRFSRGVSRASSTRQAFMMRVVTGTPLEVLDLHTCSMTDYAVVQRSSEILVVVWSPTTEATLLWSS